MRRATRVDNTQKDIVHALRVAGATVQHLHAVGEGCPDIVVGYRRKNYLLEVKVKSGTLSPDQSMWHIAWKGQVNIVTTAEEALAAIGARSSL